MKKSAIVIAALALTVIGAAPARAQAPAKAGLTMSTGSSVGVVIPLGASVAVRPHVSFVRSATDYDGNTFVTDEATSTTIAPGVSLLFTAATWNDTKFYLSPQYTYARNTSTAGGEDFPAATSHMVSGMIGVQHTLGARFAVFAETGLAWSRNRSNSGFTGENTITGTSWSTRSTVGGVLFLK